MTTPGRLYEFVFRGFLAEEALDKAGRMRRDAPGPFDPAIIERLGIELLDESAVASAERMAVVYTAIAAFENSVRKLVVAVLAEQLGESWWDNAVSVKIRNRAEARRADEETVKWHGPRGEALINYTDLSDLGTIIRSNFKRFEPYIPTIEWANSIFSVVERSRNVIMHSGALAMEDVERLGINIRDWVKQVGA